MKKITKFIGILLAIGLILGLVVYLFINYTSYIGTITIFVILIGGLMYSEVLIIDEVINSFARDMGGFKKGLLITGMIAILSLIGALGVYLTGGDVFVHTVNTDIFIRILGFIAIILLFAIIPIMFIVAFLVGGAIIIGGIVIAIELLCDLWDKL